MGPKPRKKHARSNGKIKTFKPVCDKQYLVTDQCLFQTKPPLEYNPLDPERSPHVVQLVDIKTGTIENLKSGSIIKIIQPKA
jgi:hypothetical protein